jgi:hypothetical protein
MGMTKTALAELLAAVGSSAVVGLQKTTIAPLATATILSGPPAGSRSPCKKQR